MHLRVSQVVSQSDTSSGDTVELVASPQVFVSRGRFAVTARYRDTTGNTSGSMWGYNHDDREVMKGPVSLTPRLSHSMPVLEWISEWLTTIIWPCATSFMWRQHQVVLVVAGYLLKLCLICQTKHRVELFSHLISYLVVKMAALKQRPRWRSKIPCFVCLFIYLLNLKGDKRSAAHFMV